MLDVLEFSRETEPTGCINISEDVLFKELIHTIVGAGKSKICREDQKSGNPGKC